MITSQTILLNLQPLTWDHKPTNEEVGHYIKKDMANHLRDVTPEELMTAVEKGQSFTPGALTGSKAESWKSQQLLCADIDNGKHQKDQNGCKVFVPVDDPLSSSEALRVMDGYGIQPYFMYYSFSQRTEGKANGIEKFRIVVVLDQPITDPEAMRTYTERFISIFNKKKPGVADSGTVNLDRVFFGSYAGSVFNKPGIVVPLAMLEALPKPEPIQDKPLTEYKREYVNNGSFDLLECLDYIDPDDRQIWLYVGMALRHEDYTFEDWDSWARRSTKHDYKDSLRVWNSFDEKRYGDNRGGRIITGAYITKLAKENGYIPPSKRPRPICPNVPLDWDSFIL